MAQGEGDRRRSARRADDGSGGAGQQVRTAVATAASVWRAGWWRFALLLVLVTVAFGLGGLVVLAWFHEVAVRQGQDLLDGTSLSTRGWVVLTLEVGVPAIVLTAVIMLAGIAAMAQLGDDIQAGRPPRLGRAVRRGLRRTPSALGVTVAYLATIAVLVLATPVLVVLGLVGLVLTPVARLVRRRRPSLRWPAARTFVVLAVPFGALAYVCVRWGLAIPAAALERNRPRAALRRSAALVEGRWWSTAAVLVGAIVAVVAVEALAFALGGLLSARAGSGLRLAVQLLVSAVPVIAAVALFRGAAPTSPSELAIVDPDRPGSRGPVVTGVAVPVVLALFATGAAVGSVTVVTARPAAAAPSFTVTDLGDSSDATPGDGSCATAAATCTLRAAVEEANALVSGTVAISFAGSGTVHWIGGPIVVTSDVDITGAGHHVVLDGRSCAGCSDPKQLFRLTNASGSFHLANVELANGATASANGGAAIETVAADASVDNVTFSQHTATAAPGGAVAVLGGTFTARNATFVGNSASAGADVYNAGGTVNLRQPTLWQAVGGSVANLDAAGGIIRLFNGIVDSTSGLNCTGNVQAFTVVSSDGTCGGGSVDAQLGTLADHGGDVRTVDLANTSPAIDQGDPDLCLPTDARGITRPQFNRCDPGAVEVVPTTSSATFVVNDLGDGADAGAGDGVCFTATGTCTLRAALQQATATSTAAPIAAPTYTVTFSVSGTVTVGSVLDVAANVTVDGSGQHVVVSGGGASQVFRFGDSRWPFTLRALTVRDGRLADSFGGAGVYAATNGTIDAVTFTGNVNATTYAPGLAGGGAISVDSFRTVTIVNSTFDNDSVDANLGGADLFVRGSAIVTASTFAEAYGGSVYADPAYGGTVTMNDSALKSVTGFNCTGSISGANNVSSDASTCGSGATNTDPLFTSLADHGGPVPTRALSLGSPAINAGSNATCPPTDARGVSRPQGGVCDAGAVEYVNSTTVAVGGSVNPSVLTQDVTVSADVVNGDGVVPTGTVTFREGATVLGTGTLAPAGTGANATAVVTGLTVGSHVITADYAGDANLAPSSASYTQVVGSPATVVTVTTPGATVQGQPVTVSASVSAPGVSTPATGTLTFREGATVLGTAAAPSGSVVVPVPAIGSHTYTVDYAGDAVYPAASGTGTNAVGAAATSLALTSAGATVFGQGATYTATVSVVAPGVGIPTGTVVFSAGATTLGSAALDAAGVATLTDATLDVGSHPITATYAGTSSFGGSSGGTTQVVNQAATALALAGSPSPSVHGQSITVTATVTATAPGAGTPTGTVSFFDGATPLGSAPLDGAGVASLPVSGLATGTHALSATYGGDARYVVSAGSATQVVDPSPTTVAVTSSPTVAGQGISVSVAVSPVAPGSGTPSGTVTVREGATVLGTGTLAGGTATVSIAALPVGSHTLTVDYAGDTDFVASSGSGNHTVSVASSLVTASVAGGGTVHGQAVTLQAAVAAVAPGSGTPTGTVTFRDGPTTLGVATLDGSGAASVTTAVLATGTRTITVDYAGDAAFGASSGTTSHTVSAGATSTSVLTSGTPSVLGAPVTFTATVAFVAPGGGTPAGTVTFTDGATTIGTGTLDGSGTASVTTSALGVGVHTITAAYGGDADGLPSSGTVAHDVGSAGASVTVVAGAATSVAGEPVTFTATVAAVPAGPLPTGVVTFTDGATTLGTGTLDAAGTASITTTALAVGPHSVVATYGGDGTVGAGASSGLAHTVAQAATSTAVSSSGSPSVVGQSVTFTATVAAVAPGSGTPSGSVTFADGATTIGTGTLDGSGQASVSTSALAVGPHTITATYGGDASFVGSSGTVGQSVAQAATSTVIVSSGSPSVVGQSVTFTATVAVVAPGTGTPTGTVTFTDGATTIGTGTLDGSGQASVSTSALATGPHPITASYAGSPSFAGSSSSVAQAVSQAGTTTALASSAEPSVVGQPVTFTATVTPIGTGLAPAGTVDFRVGAVLLGSSPVGPGGIATLTTSALGIGASSITASYLGSADHTASASAPLTQTVTAAGSTVTLTSSANPSVSGQSITLTGHVTSIPAGTTPTGSLTFVDGATTLGSAPLDGAGTATFTTSLAAGSHGLAAVYAGDGTVGPGSSSALAQVVDPAATSTALVATPGAAVTGQPVALVATVAVSAPGSGTPTGAVTFTDGATTLGTATLDAAGSATLTVSTLAVGAHTVTATYAGDADRATSSATAAVGVTPAATTTAVGLSADPVPFGQAVTVTATVAAVAPGAGLPTGTVTFREGATSLGSAVLDAAGHATLSLLPATGAHVITADYAGDAGFAASSGSATSTVQPATTTLTITPVANPVTYGTDATFVVHASTPTGAVPTGCVDVRVGGTTQVCTTLDASGSATATLSPRPTPGSYVVDATYAGTGDVTAASSTPVTLVVDPAPSAVALAANPVAFSAVGQSVTLTATVTGPASVPTPAGTVTFADGAAVLATVPVGPSGQATASVSTLALGSHSLAATYSSTNGLIASSSPLLTHLVVAAGTTTSLTSSPNPSVTGQPVTFQATVAAVAPGAGIPSGTVTFRDGATVLGTATLDAAGLATLTGPALAVGTHSLTAAYAAAGGYSASTSTAVTHTVDPAATSTAATASPEPTVTGQAVTATATVTTVAPGAGTPTGTVTFSIGGTTVGTATVDAAGQATATFVPAGGGGGVSILATYGGDPAHLSSFGGVLHQIDAAATTVSLSSTPAAPVAGDLVTITATVATVAPGSGVPTGQVTFTDAGTPLGTALVDGTGRATIQRQSPDFFFRGTHQITATFTGGGSYASSASAPATIVVGLAPSALTLVADSPTPPTGAPVTFTATLTTALTVPVGTSITFSEGPTALATVPVTWNGTALVATFTTSSLATGSHTITAAYGGTTDIAAASATTTVDVGLLATTVDLVDQGPSLPGQSVSLFAVVRNTATSATPTGSLRFTVDGTVLPDVAVVPGAPGTASAAVAQTFAAPGSHTVSVAYLPTGSFVGSTTSGTHLVGQYVPRLTLQTPSGGTWGAPLTFMVSMANVGPAALVAPTGTIVIGDGAGHSCQASAYNATVGGSATCTITFPSAGAATVTATYAGDLAWGSATTSRSLVLDRRAAGITGGVANGTPFTGEDTTLAWRVSGPTSGSVTTSLTGGATCASTELVGSCPIRYPLTADGVAQPITVTFAGDRDWAPASFSTSLTPAGCYSIGLSANPPEGGTLTTNPAPSCDGGTGFPRGTPVSITATPADGFRVRYLSPLQGYGTEALVTAGPPEAGGTRFAFADFVRVNTCYTVTYDTELVAGADASFFAVTQPDCIVDANGFAGPGRGAWTPSGNRLTPRALVGTFQAGSVVRFRNVVGTNGPPSRLYGYRYGYRGNPLTPGATPLDTVTVDGDKDVTAVFGPVCRRLRATTDGAGGTVSVSPATNCQDPDGPGYLPSTTARVTARVAGDGAFIDSWTVDRTARAADATQTTEVGPAPDYVRTKVATATLDVPFADGRDHDVVARFSACRALRISSVGGGEGNVTTTPAKGNCPTRADDGGGEVPGRPGVQAPRTLYFLPGAKVDLVATGVTDDHNQLLNVFDGWGPDVPTTRDQLNRANPRASATVDRDVEVKGFFYPLHDCNTLFVKVEPAGAGTVDVDGDDGLCPFRDLGKPISTTGSGMFMDPGVFNLTAQAAKGKPLVGWTLPHGEEYSDEYVEYTVPGAQTSVALRYTGQVTASFCQRINAQVTLVSPNGTSRTGPVPEGSDLIGVDPAPNCPFADDAWLVGTTVEVAALGDPAGFRFTGWKGATSATTLASRVTLDGSTPTVDLTAAYDVVCYTLTVQPYDRVDRSTAPNCPDEPTAYNRYVGGSTVTMSGRLPSSSVFTGWTGDVERTGTAPVTWVVMDRDKSAQYTYRDMTTGEKISDAFTEAGNQIAVGAKKAVGVVAAIAVALINDVPPLSIANDLMYFATGFDALMRLVGADVGITQYLAYAQQTVKFLSSTLTCASVWGLSSSSTDATTENSATRAADRVANIRRKQQQAKEAAEGLAQAEARRTYASVGATSGGLGVMSVKETTSKVNQAKLKFAKLKKVKADKAVKKAKAGAALSVGTEIYNIVDGAGGIGWDADATSAWTNGDAFESCTRDMAPDYLVEAMGGEAGE